MGESAETLRDMLRGFTAMQAHLGILPVQSAAMPMGVPLPPPPPLAPIPHPGEFSVQAVQQHQSAMQQTMQAAQMTRYVPPPSAPAVGWGRTFDALSQGQLNPYVAGMMGGGMGGLPSPMQMTSPQYGMYRPGAMSMGPLAGVQHLPPMFNPFAPRLPAPHFMSPVMQDYRVSQGMQAWDTGLVAGKMEGLFGFGGSLLGSTVGSMFGPLGSLAGGWLGDKLGGVVSNMTLGPAIADIQRGRRIQNMTSPFMVSGPNLNPFTGSGLERGAARDTAYNLRHLVRDPEIDRMGFNTGDVMRITQLASDQGLLATARTPDDITRKVKDISKAVKTLMQITGDPDVRSVIAQLGQMRNLGFEGLAGQSGAVANRAAFARMAGVSQGAMDQAFGMPGAMAAQQVGLVGATGYMAGMSGAAMANMGVSSGSFSDLQLARAGGKQGVSQINMMAQLGAMNQDIFMAAALKRGAGGELGIDIDAYRRAQRMDISQVSSTAANNLRELGPEGIFQLRTRRQEFKDQLAQQMSPFEMQLNTLRQARSLQKRVPGMTLGSAFYTMIGSTDAGRGMSDEERETAARTMELQFSNPEQYDSMMQQLRAQRRQAADRERARREQWRTPGFLTRAGRSFRNTLGGISDSFSQPFADASEYFSQVEEDRSAFERGERIQRWSGSELIRTPQERALAARMMRSQRFQEGYSRLSGPDYFAPDRRSLGQQFMGAGAGMVGTAGNAFTTYLGFTSYDEANRINDVAARSRGTLFGLHPFSSIGDAQSSFARVQDVAGAGRATEMAETMTGAKAADVMTALQQKGGASGAGFNARTIVMGASRRLRAKLPKAGDLTSAGAAAESMIRESWIEACREKGVSDGVANSLYTPEIRALIVRDIMMSGDQKAIETLQNAVDIEGRAGSFSGKRQRDALKKDIHGMLEHAGLTTAGTTSAGRARIMSGELHAASEKDVERVKQVIGSHNEKVLALASAMLGESSGAERERRAGATTRDMIEATYGSDAAGQRAFQRDQAEASALIAKMDTGSKNVFLNMLKSGGLGVMHRFGEAREAVGMSKASQATQTVLNRVADQTGRKDIVNMGLEQAAMSLSDEEVGAITDSKLREAFQAVRAGKKGAREQLQGVAIEHSAKAAVEMFGGGGGKAVRDIDAQIDEIERLKGEVAKGKADDPSAQLWADTAELLAGAAKDLRAVTDNYKLAAGSPSFQSMWAGFAGKR